VLTVGGRSSERETARKKFPPMKSLLLVLLANLIPLSGSSTAPSSHATTPIDSLHSSTGAAAQDSDAQKGRPCVQRGGLVGCRPDLTRQHCPPPCYQESETETETESSSPHVRRQVHRVPAPPRRYQRRAHHCPSSSRSASCNIREIHTTRPPPLVGSAERVQVLAYAQPLVTPILLNATWSMAPLSSGSFYPNTLQFNGTNTQPALIRTVTPIPLALLDTLYLSAQAIFTAIPMGPVDSAYGIDEDPQYGSASIGFYDVVTGIRYAFLLTNSRVYVLYQQQSDIVLPSSTLFGYLVPVAERMMMGSNEYGLALSRSLRTVTFLMDGQTKLVLTRPSPLDPKFLVSGTPPTTIPMDFPLSLTAELGISTPLMAYPVCQHTLYDQCTRYQSLQNAGQMVCTRGAVQVNLVNVALSLSLGSLSIYRVSHIYPPCSPAQCQY